MKKLLSITMAALALTGCPWDDGTTAHTATSSSATSSASVKVSTYIGDYASDEQTHLSGQRSSYTIDRSHPEAVGYLFNGALMKVMYYSGNALVALKYYVASTGESRAYTLQRPVVLFPDNFTLGKIYNVGSLADVTDANTAVPLGVAQLTWTTEITAADEPGCILVHTTYREAAGGQFVTQSISAETRCPEGTIYYSQDGSSWAVK